MSDRSDLIRTRLMGAFFALGAACFMVAPLDAYGNAVGTRADLLTFFVGSILFTLGGLTQSWLSLPERRQAGAGLRAWRAAWVQSVGTLLFNFMTFEAISVAAASGDYNTLVWSPNALGSLCFLISGAYLYLSSPRRGWLPVRHPGWWESPLNGLGCILFGASAVAGLVVSVKGEMVSVSAANWTTTLGAACFFTVALAALGTGRSLKVPRLMRFRELEQLVERDVEQAAGALTRELSAAEAAVEREMEQVVRAVESSTGMLGNEPVAE